MSITMSKILVRPGWYLIIYLFYYYLYSESRSIYLPQSKSIRKFEYQNPKENFSHELSGSLSIRTGHIEPKETLLYLL